MGQIKRIAGLSRCNKCQREHSVVQAIHYDKGYRLMYCKAKGCGYRDTIPYPLTIVNADGIRQVNIIHKPIVKPKEICDCGMTIDEAERSCIYVNQDCKAYCIRNAMNERGVPYE